MTTAMLMTNIYIDHPAAKLPGVPVCWTRDLPRADTCASSPHFTHRTDTVSRDSAAKMSVWWAKWSTDVDSPEVRRPALLPS